MYVACHMGLKIADHICSLFCVIQILEVPNEEEVSLLLELLE